MFYHYYDGIRTKLGEEKYELLKESITFFSNPEQEGKPNEEQLRALFLSRVWDDLDEAVEAGVDLLLKS